MGDAFLCGEAFHSENSEAFLAASLSSLNFARSRRCREAPLKADALRARRLRASDRKAAMRRPRLGSSRASRSSFAVSLFHMELYGNADSDNFRHESLCRGLRPRIIIQCIVGCAPELSSKWNIHGSLKGMLEGWSTPACRHRRARRLGGCDGTANHLERRRCSFAIRQPSRASRPAPRHTGARVSAVPGSLRRRR